MIVQRQNSAYDRAGSTSTGGMDGCPLFVVSSNQEGACRRMRSEHNRFSLPAHLPRETELAAHVVRDADKLDILRIMDEHLGGPGPYSPTVVLNLPDDPALAGKAVLRAALAGQVAAYADLRSVNDFRVLLGTWFFDMHFAASRRQFVEDGHARRLLEGLPQNATYGPVRVALLKRLDGARERD